MGTALWEESSPASAFGLETSDDAHQNILGRAVPTPNTLQTETAPEVLLRDAEKHIREWVGTPSCAREYYFELCVSEWPVVHLLDRVQAKLNSLFTLDERPGQSCDAVHGACPACPCARQGEWIKEARFVSRFHAAVNALLGPHAIPVRID